MSSDNEESWSTKQSQAQDRRMLESHAAMIAKRFDTVQIIVTRHHENKGTHRTQAGRGNVYARLESCAEWVRNVRRE